MSLTFSWAQGPFSRPLHSERHPDAHCHIAPVHQPAEFSPLRSGKVVHLINLAKNVVPYEQAWRWQQQLVAEVLRQQANNQDSRTSSGVLLLLQHDPVYTLGAGSTVAHLHFDPAAPPHPLYRTERGGEATYHGPGQLVMYPILDLRCFRSDLHWYMRSLEEVAIRALAAVSGIEAAREAGLTGVWAGGAKVAAIGVRARRWVTYHGMALNITADLDPFAAIVPCGIIDRTVTSVKQIHTVGKFGFSVDDNELLDDYATALLAAFCKVFCTELQDSSMAAMLGHSNALDFAVPHAV